MPERSAQSVLTLREDLPFRCWGDRAVVFDPESGGTFLLESVGACALEVLIAKAPLAVSELEQRLLHMLEDPAADTEGLRLHLQETLDIFASRGWITSPLRAS